MAPWVWSSTDRKACLWQIFSNSYAPSCPHPRGARHIPIHVGGPVQTDRGFVLHPTGPVFQATVDLGGISLSTSQDVLFSIADGYGPDQNLITLGYAGWDAGQLDAEFAANAWLNCAVRPWRSCSRSTVKTASTPLRRNWAINLNLLTSQAGHA
jgi:putative transcriptional regulator